MEVHGFQQFSAKKIFLNGYSINSVSKNEKFYDFETDGLHNPVSMYNSSGFLHTTYTAQNMESM